MAQMNLSPRTKCHRLRFSNGSKRSKKMVRDFLTADPPKRPPPQGNSAPAIKEAHRPFKRTRAAEDHVFDHHFERGDVPNHRFKPKNSSALAAEDAPFFKSQNVADTANKEMGKPSPARELPQASPPPELRRHSPGKLASLIEQPSPSPGKSPSPSRNLPNGHRLASQINMERDRMTEDSRTVESSGGSNLNLASPPKAGTEQSFFPSRPNGYGNLLKLVGSPEFSGGDHGAPACSPRRLHNEQNGGSSLSGADSALVQLKPGGGQNLQRLAGSHELPAARDCFKGLWNLGNTCYMNAVIQLLYNLDCFTEDTRLPGKYGLQLPGDGIFTALQRVFARMLTAACNGIISPEDLQSACERYMTDFSGSIQQDAQEFLLNVLDKIEGEITSSSQNLQLASKEVPWNFNNICPITRNFSCRVRNILSCEGCDCVVHVNESCRHFSLPLPEDCRDPQAEVPDIEALLDLYFKAEKLSRKCEKCGAETVKLETKILELPRVLVLHINRFKMDSNMHCCNKVSVPVKFRGFLDLGKWCVGKARDSSAIEERTTNGRQDVPGAHVPNMAGRGKQVESTNFYLHGVVSHVGKLASCGHYTADICNRDSSKWVRCDDSVVREVTPEEVFCREKAGEAYVFLYVRCQ